MTAGVVVDLQKCGNNMTFQQTLMWSSSTVEMGSESSTRASTGLISDDSTALNTPGVRQSEKEEYEETVASPVAPTPGVDDYPDGGFAAWCVVLGVSQLNHCLVFSVLLIRVRSCSRRVLFSRRMLYFTSLVSNNRLTLEDSLRSGPASAWGVRAFQILSLADVVAHLETGVPIVLRTDSHTRNFNLNNVSPQFFTSSVQSI